jgi:ketosteroid isomerase-like protein
MSERPQSASQENAKVVERALAALNARDVDGYLSSCTDDVELRTPLAAAGGVYTGHNGIRRFFADVEDAAPDFRIELRELTPLAGDIVLASIRTSSTGRASGIPLDSEATNVYRLSGGRISRVEIYLDPVEARRAADASAE